MKNSFNLKWHRVTIAKPELSHGRCLREFFVELLNNYVPSITKVVFTAVEGGGDSSRGLTGSSQGQMNKEELLNRLQFTDQLDWANFFFFEKISDSDAVKIFGELDIIEAIDISLITVRVIDDSDVDVFTQDADLVRYLLAKYIDAKIESGSLDDMTFPS